MYVDTRQKSYGYILRFLGDYLFIFIMHVFIYFKYIF